MARGVWVAAVFAVAAVGLCLAVCAAETQVPAPAATAADVGAGEKVTPRTTAAVGKVKRRRSEASKGATKPQGAAKTVAKRRTKAGCAAKGATKPKRTNVAAGSGQRQGTRYDKGKVKGKGRKRDSAMGKPKAEAVDAKAQVPVQPDGAAAEQQPTPVPVASATGAASSAAAAEPTAAEQVLIDASAADLDDDAPVMSRAQERQSNTFAALKQWLLDAGATVSDSVSFGHFTGSGGGWGLKAAAPIDGAGVVLLRVPDRAILTAQRVLEVKPQWQPLTQVLDDDGLIGLFLAVQRFHRPKAVTAPADAAAAFWSPFVDSLPTVCINGEVLDKAAMRVLQPTTLHKRLVRKKRQRTLEWQYLVALSSGKLQPSKGDSEPLPVVSDPALQHVTLSEYVWGVCSKRTRSFDIGMSGKSGAADTSEAGLVPLCDWANHAPNKTATYAYADGAFELRSVRAQRPGEQILISYGRGTPNSEFLSAFGFVVAGNAAHDALPISLWPALSGPTDDRVKARIVRTVMGATAVHVYRDGMSQADMALLRVALLQGAELTALNVGRCLSAALEEMCVSPEHELRVIIWLTDRLYGLLGGHTTLPAADVKIIRKLRRRARSSKRPLKPADAMRLVAVQYRLVEKLTIISFLKRTGAWED